MLCAYLPAAVWKQQKDVVKSLRNADVDRQMEKIEEKNPWFLLETELLSTPNSGKSDTTLWLQIIKKQLDGIRIRTVLESV